MESMEKRKYKSSQSYRIGEQVSLTLITKGQGVYYMIEICSRSDNQKTIKKKTDQKKQSKTAEKFYGNMVSPQSKCQLLTKLQVTKEFHIYFVIYLK